MKLEGRFALITGASQGLGEYIARAYATEGANLTLTARNFELLEKVAESLPRSTNQQIIALSADVSKPADNEKLVQIITEKFGRLDVLVNNAGVYGPIGNFEEVDWQEWVDAININLIGTVGLTRAFIPLLKKQGYGKIINLSGGGATNPLPRFSAYAASKAAIVRMTETLALELLDYHIDVNAIAPGALNTRLLDQVLAAGPEKAGETFFHRSIEQKNKGGADPQVGSKLAVFLASAESDGISGKLISAIWDDWANFPIMKEKLQKSDVYTLRRIVPEDRDWQ
jgi:NAD(P)-dependent dehydrogenase (short-subunit alcohol dehydrogenase family)